MKLLLSVIAASVLVSDTRALGGNDAPLPENAIARLGSASWTLTSEGRKLALSPDGKELLVANENFEIDRINIENGRRLSALGVTSFTWGFDISSAMAFSTDGKLFAMGGFWEERNRKRQLHASIIRWSDKQEIHSIKFSRREDKVEDPPEVKGLSSWGSLSFEYLSVLAFSPDGKTLATGSRTYRKYSTTENRKEQILLEREDNVVLLWDLASGKQSRELKGHTREIHTIIFSADGKRLTTASQDGTVRFWSTATGQECEKAWKAGEAIFCATYSPDQMLFAAGCQKSVLVWETKTGRLLHRLELPGQEIRAVLFSPDGKTLAAGGGNSIRLWSAATGERIGDLEPVASRVQSLAFASDGQTLYSIHKQEQRISRWEVPARRRVSESAGHRSPVRLLAYTPDGKRVLTHALNEDFRAWDIAGGNAEVMKTDDSKIMTALMASTGRSRPLLCENSFAATLALMLGKVTRLDLPGFLGASIDGQRVLSQRENKPGFLVSDRDGAKKEIAGDEWDRGTAALSPDGTTVAGVGGDGSLSLFDVASGKCQKFPVFVPKQKTDTKESNFKCTTLKFSLDGTRVAAADKQAVYIVSARDGRLIRTIHLPDADGLAFSPDGKTLLTMCSSFHSGIVAIWEVSTGGNVRLEPPGIYQFTADNRAVAEMTVRGLQLRDLYGGTVLRDFKNGDVFAYNFTFAPDGRTLAAAYSDCTVIVWDAKIPAAVEKKTKRDQKRLEQLWSDLEKSDAERAYAAMGIFVADPGTSLTLIENKIRYWETIDQERIAGWISELDNDDFQTREEATRGLYLLGGAAADALKAASRKDRTPEKERRLNWLLERLEQNPNLPPPGELSCERAIQVLERINSKESQQLLRRIAEKMPGACALSAKEALARLVPTAKTPGK